jgi:hypothetical protein
VSVTLKVAFDLVSPEDGSKHSIQLYGEALDPGDKATAKALTAAYKSAMLQTFCVPVTGTEDPDASSHRLRAGTPPPVQTTAGLEPVQGWQQWSADIGNIVASCETAEALERVQNSNRALLRSLSREQPQLYAELGEAFSIRTEQLSLRSQASLQPTPAVRRKKTGPSPKRSKGNGAAAPIH